ncbi:hypothetical protein Dimus_037279 [Dionaea muscipula]
MEDSDWELLNNSESGAEEHPGGDSDSDDGIIHSDYFSLDSHHKYAASAATLKTPSEQGSVVSDNPSWIDPGSEEAEALCPARTNSGDFWSGSSSSDRPPDMMMGGGGCGAANFNDEMVEETIVVAAVYSTWADQGGIAEATDEVEAGSPVVLVEKETADEPEKDEAGGMEEVISRQGKQEEVKEKRRVVWWKVPWELLKCFVFRASPVWSFSVAAAVMGFVILGRRLYKMKRKTQGLQPNLNVDDKKVSQLISHVARLNEAFSVVRRVPVIRPSLPSQPAVAPWPVIGLR